MTRTSTPRACASCCEKIAALGLAVPVTLVLDNARYQKCVLVQQLADELGIELLYLPSYSPNLNLIERLWKFVKKKVLNAKYYEDFGPFKTAIGGCIADAPTEVQGRTRLSADAAVPDVHESSVTGRVEYRCIIAGVIVCRNGELYALC